MGGSTGTGCKERYVFHSLPPPVPDWRRTAVSGNFKVWAQRFVNGFLPPGHPALADEPNRRRINVLMSMTAAAVPTMAIWALFLFPVHPQHAITYGAFLICLAGGTAFVILGRGRHVTEVIILLVFAAWLTALIRSALSAGNPAAEMPYVAALVAGLTPLLHR